MSGLRIGPSGNSSAFYAEGHKHTYEAAQWLHALGLNAYEYSFGRGVHIGDAGADKIKEEFDKYGIEISAHAPYFTNFSNPDEEMIEKSFGYILDSLTAVRKMGGVRVVFHPASCGKADRAEAVALAERNIVRLTERVHAAFDATWSDYILCPETMGKMRQIGRVEEIVRFCKADAHLYPCYDFGHINSYSQGGLKTQDDYRLHRRAVGRRKDAQHAYPLLQDPLRRKRRNQAPYVCGYGVRAGVRTAGKSDRRIQTYAVYRVRIGRNHERRRFNYEKLS